MLDTKMQEAIAKSTVKDFFGNFSNAFNETIKEIKFELTENKSSNFDFSKKIIYINKDYATDVNHYVHELLHAVSTNYFADRVHIGFNKKSFKPIDGDLLLENSYGYAINEGATHSLTIQSTKGKFGEIVPISSYNFCANIYKNLENVVGSTVLRLTYLNSGIRELISTVSKACHTNEENVLKLVLNMDAYFDVANVYRVFIEKEYAEDVKKLLSNCYSYLAKIMKDNCMFEGKKFDAKTMISAEHLQNDELRVFHDALNNIEDVSSNKIVTMKEYEKMAFYLISQAMKNNINSFDIVGEKLKCSEFYNFLLLNNYVCDNDRIRKDFLTGDLQADLTQKIFEENFKAFSLDKNLVQNVETLLATRYAVRANTETSDYYMYKCLDDEKFSTYLKNSDKKYYESLKEEKAL